MIYQLVSHTDNSVVMTRFTGMMCTNQVHTSASTDYVVCTNLFIVTELSIQMPWLPSRVHDEIVVIVSSSMLQ